MFYFKELFISCFILFLSSCATIPLSKYNYDVPIEQFESLKIDDVYYEIGFIYNVSNRPKYKNCLENQYIISHNLKGEWKSIGNLKNKLSERVCIDHNKRLVLVIFDAWYDVMPSNLIGKEFITCSNIYGKNAGRGFKLIEGNYRPRSDGFINKYIYHHCTSFFLEEVGLSKAANVISNVGSLGLNYALGNNPVFLSFSHEKVVSAITSSLIFEKSRKTYYYSIVMKLKKSLITLEYLNGRINGSFSKPFTNAIEEFLSDEGRGDILCDDDCSNLLQSEEFLSLIDKALMRIR